MTPPYRQRLETAEYEKRSTKNMIITTTHAIEGRRISRYLGIVTGETLLGVDVMKNLFRTVRDFHDDFPCDC